jgi:hypothetical protein
MTPEPATENENATTLQQSSASDVNREDPVVDPRPTAAPIALDNKSLKELMESHPAEASSDEVLAGRPNRYEDATVGPDRQISQIEYVEMTKRDGTTCLVPLANVPYYRWKGFTEGAHQDIPDLPAYWAEKAKTTMSEQSEQPRNRDAVQPAQTQQPTQPPEDVLQRLAGVPKTAEELEQERQEVEREREGRFAETRQPAPGTMSAPPEHPHGGPPGQTGEHPQGGPPGQTGEPPQGGPPPTAETLPTEPEVQPVSAPESESEPTP